MSSLHYYGVLSKYNQQFITKPELFGVTRNTELLYYLFVLRVKRIKKKNLYQYYNTTIKIVNVKTLK